MELHYVYKKYIDENDPVFRKIKEFCNMRSVKFKLRTYNVYDYEEDREFVARLPALQLYKNTLYQETIYPDFKPIQFLTLEIDKFELEELERQAKTQIWEERIKHLKNLFRSLKTDSNEPKPDRN